MKVDSESGKGWRSGGLRRDVRWRRSWACYAYVHACMSTAVVHVPARGMTDTRKEATTSGRVDRGKCMHVVCSYLYDIQVSLSVH